MSIMAISASAVLALTGGMQSANNISNPGGVMTSFDAGQLQSIVQQMGWQVQSQSTGDGEQFLAVTASNGIRFGMRPTVCQATGRCLGVFILAPFPPADGSRIFDFNNQVPFIKASSYGSQGSYVARYEIADGGYVRGNLRYILTNFAGIAGTYQRTMGGMSVSNDPDSVLADFNAEALNRQAATNVQAVNVSFGEIFGETHSNATMEIDEAIDTFMGAGDTLMNAIDTQ